MICKLPWRLTDWAPLPQVRPMKPVVRRWDVIQKHKRVMNAVILLYKSEPLTFYLYVEPGYK